MRDLRLSINGKIMSTRAEPRELLLDVLRDRFGLTGAKRSCEVQVCGACTVLLDGQPVSACCTLAADAEGHEILTIEGFAGSQQFSAFEDAFTRHAGLQCGFCTPGMLLTVKFLIDSGDMCPDSAGIKEALAGNLCRCTGYRGIVEAVQELAQQVTSERVP